METDDEVNRCCFS